MTHISFAAYFRTASDCSFATNALRFATREEAEGYGADLYQRWLGAKEWEVRETDDPVRHRWDAKERTVVNI